MLRSLGKTPHTIVGKSAICGIESLPSAVLVLSQAAIEGTKIHGAILHGGAAHDDIGGKTRLSSVKYPALTRDRIVAYDAMVVGATPEIADKVLGDGTDVAQWDGIKLGGSW